jgi:HSP20 family protein
MAQLPARRSARNITPVDPSGEFEDIYDRMGQLMSMAFGDLAFTPALAAAWTPLADISETDDAYLVEVELPGVNKDQVNVDVNDRELVITGEIAEPQEEGRRRRRRARRTGRFEFRTTLPGDIDPQGVSASISDGILTVRVPKSEAAKPRRVEISG